MVLGFCATSAQAGSVSTLDGNLATDGKLVLGAKAIQVQTGTSSEDVNLPDILEADFGDTPLQLDYFSSQDNLAQLPGSWKMQDIGHVDAPGSCAYKNGTFVFTHAGVEKDKSDEQIFYAGQPWTGDGQWTVRVLDVKGPQERTEAGLMLRDTLDAGAPLFSIGVTMETDFKAHFRREAQKGNENRPIYTKLQFPVWLRLTRYGTSLAAAISSNGKDWETVSQAITKPTSSVLIGLYIANHKGKTPASAILDQASFTPRPYSGQVIPPGMLLVSGSVLATDFSFDSDPTKPETDGHLQWFDKYIPIPQKKISILAFHPIPRSQVDSIGSQVGIIMRNGDFMGGDLELVYRNNIRISSLLLGIVSYDNDDLLGCFYHPPQFQPSDYEVRLRDGSILRAKNLSLAKDKCTIEEISGLNLDVPADAIAQVRAGLTRAQPLIDLPWKSPQSAAAPAAAPNPASPAPTTNAPPAPPPDAQTAQAGTPPSPEALQAANPIPPQPPIVKGWGGNNQEQILVVPAGMSVDFPLPGKFRSVAMRVGFSPDTPSNATATLHILADGREVSVIPPFKAGDPPRFVQATLSSPRTLTIRVDSFEAKTRLLLIDPVAVRQE